MTGRAEAPGTRPARPPGGEALRWLVAPWTLLVFFPLVVLTTAFWGAVTVLIALVSRRAAFHTGEIWAACLTWASFVRVRVRGREQAPRGSSYVIVCNHQGFYDILALYGFLRRQFRWVMKAELRRIPFLGWGCAAIGHIFVDRRDPQQAIASLEAAKPQLEGGVSVLFFPEGTRSRDGRLLPFKKGAFVMARQLGLPILPVTLVGSAGVLPRGRLFPRPGTIEIHFHPPIDPASAPNAEQLAQLARAAVESAL